MSFGSIRNIILDMEGWIEGLILKLPNDRLLYYKYVNVLNKLALVPSPFLKF